jgi:hypothetical protein
MKVKEITKPLLILSLLTILLIEFLSLSLFYDLDFHFFIYSPEPGVQYYSSGPMYQSPVTLVVLKHECFLTRIETHILTDFDSEIIISFPNGSITHITGENHYTFINVLPGKFPPITAGSWGWGINGHDISIDKPVEVFLEKADWAVRYKYDAPRDTSFILANITVVSGFALVTVSVWGVML